LEGHIQLVDEKSLPKGVLEGNITAKRPVGKPTKKWVNALEIVE
jgi:hypothetical protein